MNPVFPTMQHQQLLLSTLRLLGVSRVVVDFSGSGDSGNMDGVRATNAQDDDVDLSQTTIVWPRGRMEGLFEGGVYKRKTTHTDELMSLEAIISHMCERALDETHLDWYNNDGGQGHFTIDLTNEVPNITLEVGINFMQTEDHTFEYYEPLTEEEANAPVPSQPE